MDFNTPEASRFDTPKGNEAQCVICWRLFTSDSACERHKPYSKPKTDICKYPEIVGLEPMERRGLVIWTRRAPTPALPPE